MKHKQSFVRPRTSPDESVYNNTCLCVGRRHRRVSPSEVRKSFVGPPWTSPPKRRTSLAGRRTSPNESIKKKKSFVGPRTSPDECVKTQQILGWYPRTTLATTEAIPLLCRGHARTSQSERSRSFVGPQTSLNESVEKQILCWATDIPGRAHQRKKQIFAGPRTSQE